MYKPDNENITKTNFYSNNKWNIPEIQGIKQIDEKVQFIGFNYAKTFKKAQIFAKSTCFYLENVVQCRRFEKGY